MKIALCFIINYHHILNKEDIWKEWIEYNKDIINVYFYYKDINKIKSAWILKHTIPPNFIQETSYMHVVPAYISIMSFALNNDKENQWFCFLTDSCSPVISPKRFRYLFYSNYKKTIMSWKKAWWNIDFHKRANLALLPPDLRLANDPWFVIKREHAYTLLNYINAKKEFVKVICNGGLANESIFAIILYACKQLTVKNVISGVTHATDWSRMTSATSPHFFKEANKKDTDFIEKSLKDNENIMFIRKIAPEFPDQVLKYYIYNYSKKEDDKLVLVNPFFYKKILYHVDLIIRFILFIGPIIFIYRIFY